MKKKSTSTSDSGSALSIAAVPEASKSKAGSPRLSTLSRIRQFARAYHCEQAAGIQTAMILN